MGAVNHSLTHIAYEALDTAVRLQVYAELRASDASTPEEVAERTGVGVERVRKSLRQLENEGIVDVKEENGVYTYSALSPTGLVKNLPYAVRVRTESVFGL